MPKKIARTESEVLKKISDWCSEKHPRVEVQKSEYEKFIESTREKRIIDVTLIGRYARKSRSGAKGCLISELEFEEHKADYSILKDQIKITVPLRKIYYWRNDIPQYWIKIDKDGTPFMINFRYIYNGYELGNIESMPPKGKWTKKEQLDRIVAAQRQSKDDDWPKYVVVGWTKIFKELNRVINLAKF